MDELIQTVEALKNEWQEELGLRDWTIRIFVVNRDLLGEDHGKCTPRLKKREACIEVLHPNDFDYEANIVAYDLEQTIVHELLHCKLAAFEGKLNSVRDVIQEQAIHDQSILLVRMKRIEREYNRLVLAQSVRPVAQPEPEIEAPAKKRRARKATA